jgi:hypothetical protein
MQRVSMGTPSLKRVVALDARVAAHAFFADLRRAAIHRLLVRALLHAFTVAAAALLVDEHNAVFFTLVDRLARAGGQTGGIGAVVADAHQVEEPRLVLRQRRAVGAEMP